MRYHVTVSYTKVYKKTLDIYAPNEEEAECKAEDIVYGWDDVDDVEVDSIEEAE